MFGWKRFTRDKLRQFQDEMAAIGVADAVIKDWVVRTYNTQPVWTYETFDLKPGIRVDPEHAGESGYYIYTIEGSASVEVDGRKELFRFRFKRFWIHRPKGKTTGASSVDLTGAEIGKPGALRKFSAWVTRFCVSGMQPSWSITRFSFD